MPIRAYKRASGVYHLRGSHLGTRIDRSAQTGSREEAELLAATLQKEIFEARVYGPKRTALFAEAATGYLNGGGEADYLEPLIQALGARRLCEISQAELDKLALTLHSADRAGDATRLRKVYTPFIAAWNWAVRDGLAEPRKWWKPSPGPRRLDWRTPAEIEKLLAPLPEKVRSLATFYVGTGARATEALDLVWRDVAAENERVTFWETKGDYSRHVDLGARVREALPARPDDEALRVFVHTHNQPWHGYDAVNLALKRGCARAGIAPLSCHVLRHTWASWTYALTKDLNHLMMAGGWKSPALAMRYVHMGTDALAKEVRAYGWEEP